MPATQCGEDKSVIQRLLDEPHRFQFFQAVRLVVQWLGEHGVSPGRALVEHLKFENSLSLNFPPSEIESMRTVDDGAVSRLAPELAMLERPLLQVSITPSFMGFLGANGSLPQHYTERILAYELSQRDPSARAFFDMFSSRAVALFYEAWRKYRLEHAISDGEDVFLPLLLALAGFQRGEVKRSDGVGDRAIALYAGVLQQRPVSSVILGRVLSNYFSVPIGVQEAVGHWNRMAPHEQTSLCGPNSLLGENTMLGDHSWRPDLRARLSIGPLNMAEFKRFLPGADASVALKRMLGLFGEQTLVYEVELVIRAEEIRPVCLVGERQPGALLGLASFLITRPCTKDRTDMRYEIRPMAPLAPRRTVKQGGGNTRA
jgi:type VI secretion system protein ImpH